MWHPQQAPVILRLQCDESAAEQETDQDRDEQTLPRIVADGAPEVIAYFGDTKPASTTVQVARLVHPDWLVEIEATAIIDG